MQAARPCEVSADFRLGPDDRYYDDEEELEEVSSSQGEESYDEVTEVDKLGENLPVARMIFNLRWIFLIAWPILAIGMAPFAWNLLLTASPMIKEAPQGTESTHAMAVFERHFHDLATIRREMVVMRCRTLCQTAASDLSRGYVEQVQDLIQRFERDNPGSIVDVSSYFTYAGHHQLLGANPMLSHDRQSILLLWVWRMLPGMKEKADALIGKVQETVDEINTFQGADGLEVKLTGLVTLDLALQETLIEEIPVHEISTIWLPFGILAFALRSPRMLLLALIPMPVEILCAFGIIYFASLRSTVLFYSLMMMLMLCTSLSFDYALFLLTRYAEERLSGHSVKDSLLMVISQSGRVIFASAAVLMLAWMSMLGLPMPFNTFSAAACSMIFVCALVQLTFVPALLAAFPFLGPPAACKRQTRKPDSVKNIEGISMLDSGREDLEESDNPMMRAAPHMRGIGFGIGKLITACPLNIIVPILIYTAMSPLTTRMTKNFDLGSFTFRMGHSYALGIPRQREEWSTALQIQQDFPSSVGIMMPMLIIGTNAVPSGNKLHEFHRPPPPQQPVSPTTAELDVRGDAFFQANCRMVNSLIAATRNKPWALKADSLLSATFRGREDNGEGVKCLSYWQVNMVRSNYLARNWFLKRTSKNVERLWDQVVSSDNHAMLTFLFPSTDPFSPEAFSLVRDVRDVLRNETAYARRNTSIPDLTFMTFSPGSSLMDLIEVTLHSLSFTFSGCVAVSLALVALWFRSVLIPVKLVTTVVVPITWTYGAALYVYEDGVAESLGVPGVAPLKNYGMDWTVPLFTLTFLVGLAFDYEIFLIERVREFREEGFGDRESIQLGLAATGDTITFAGLIMAFTFAAQMLGSIPATNQMGFILVFSIVTDTFIVRTILLPAMLSLVPSANYWPAKMPPIRYRWLFGCRGTPEMLLTGDGRLSLWDKPAREPVTQHVEKLRN